MCFRYSSFCLRQRYGSRPINSYFPVIMSFWIPNVSFFSFYFLFTSSQVQHSWWHSIGRTGQHHTRCPGDGIRCRWQGNGPRSRTRSMMTSPANNAATSSIRKGHTKQLRNIKKKLSPKNLNFYPFFRKTFYFVQF